MIDIFLIVLALSMTYGSPNLLNGNDEGLDTGTVVLANVLFRHGNRTIINPYPNDPFKNSSFWPLGWGQLTEDGIRGHYELGKWLRRQYGDLLPQAYSPNDIHIQSTNVDRTLMSAQSNLAGLYFRDPTTKWNPGLPWRPIPVHTVPQHDDKVLACKKPCPRYDYLIKKQKASSWYQEIVKENQLLFETVREASGAEVQDIDSLEYVYDTLFIEHLFKYPLPNWTQSVFPGPMKNLSDFSFSLPCFTAELARLKIGNLLGEFASNMEKKISGTLKPDRKMFVHSGHDNTVANVLQALGVFNKLCPPYFSTVLVDLRIKDDQYFVTVQYRNSSYEDAHLLTIPGCTPLCPYDQFRKIVDPLVPKDWDSECQLTMVEEIYQVTQLGMLVLASMASFIIILLGSVCFICRRQRMDDKDFLYQSLAAEAT